MTKDKVLDKIGKDVYNGMKWGGMDEGVFKLNIEDVNEFWDAVKDLEKWYHKVVAHYDAQAVYIKFGPDSHSPVKDAFDYGYRKGHVAALNKTGYTPNKAWREREKENEK